MTKTLDKFSDSVNNLAQSVSALQAITEQNTQNAKRNNAKAPVKRSLFFVSTYLLTRELQSYQHVYTLSTHLGSHLLSYVSSLQETSNLDEFQT
ncbi:hypothetical protein EAMBIBNC_00087 [Citrobacter phage BSwM KMM4]|nr:hypothetical protein EAMBIBNC_00087 [Citrobacter phage BSwM KMM4]